MKQILNFPASYEVQLDAELPPREGQTIYFADKGPQSQGKGMSGSLMRIKSRDGSSWLAVFPKGYTHGFAVDAILSTPNPDFVCVISDGAGYWENSVTRECAAIRILPIRQFETMERLLLFADFTRIAAYSPEGLLWISAQLAGDRLSIIGMDPTAKLIECEGWDPASGGSVRLKVDSRTGKLAP